MGTRDTDDLYSRAKRVKTWSPKFSMVKIIKKFAADQQLSREARLTLMYCEGCRAPLLGSRYIRT